MATKFRLTEEYALSKLHLVNEMFESYSQFFLRVQGKRKSVVDVSCPEIEYVQDNEPISQLKSLHLANEMFEPYSQI